MKLDELLISEENTVLEAMKRLDVTGHRILFIAPEGRLAAVITDSDVRRHILRGGSLDAPVREMANYNPKWIPVGQRASAKRLLLKYSIDALPVLDKQGVICDVIFEGDLNVDTHKKTDLPVVIMAGGLAQDCTPIPRSCQNRSSRSESCRSPSTSSTGSRASAAGISRWWSTIKRT